MQNNKTVLIVDDSRVSRLITRQFILSHDAGWIVEEAADGEDAVARAAALSPALVLMDVNMPGMGGVAAAEQLRVLLPLARISLLTANVQDATRSRAARLGLGFIGKPITEARIHQFLQPVAA